MPRPARDPQRRYSESTTWWQCPFCFKQCKSKGGRTQHIRHLHGNDVSGNSIILDTPGDESFTALDLDHLNPPRPNGTQEEDTDAMDFDFSTFPLSADTNSASPFKLTPSDNTLPSSPPSNTSMEFNDFGSNQSSRSPTTMCHPVMNGK